MQSSSKRSVIVVVLGLSAQTAACSDPAPTPSVTCGDGHYSVDLASADSNLLQEDGTTICGYADDKAVYLYWSIPAEFLTVEDMALALRDASHDPASTQEAAPALGNGLRVHGKGDRGEVSAVVASDANVVVTALVLGRAEGNDAAAAFLASFRVAAATQPSGLRAATTKSALRGARCELDQLYSDRCQSHISTSSLCTLAKLVPEVGETVGDFCRDVADEARREACERGSCGAGEACLANVCCRISESVCGGVCYSPKNCQTCLGGVIGTACDACSTCRPSMTLLDPGECESSCGSGACCSDQCADTRSDEQNCGTCGNVCGAGEGCTDGHCGHYCPLCRTWDVATQACAEACDGAQCEICNVTGASSFICESQCMAGDTCHNGTCLTDCTPCTGFDGFVDCCTAAQTCDSTPHKGPPCR